MQIDVAKVLTQAHTQLRGLETFCSVSKLEELVEILPRGGNGFEVATAGTSTSGRPIHHVRFGMGAVKVLLVGFPHCHEPIGGLTVFTLLSLLRRGVRELIEADVEWHIVPCIDPDGAVLNEGWSQNTFSLTSYMRNFHLQPAQEQVDCSFPIQYKRLAFDRPTREARVLQQLLERIRPDFYYPLHNAWAGGAWHCLSRNIAPRYRRELNEMFLRYRLPVQSNPPWKEWCEQFGEGLCENFTLPGYYDYLERTSGSPEKSISFGACSWDYLATLNPGALTFLTELPYVRHPSDGSQQPTRQHLRQLKLRIDADNKFLVTAILEEWEKVRTDLDVTSPRYHKIIDGVISTKDNLCEGLAITRYPTRELLYSPEYVGVATEGERFNIWLYDRFLVLCQAYEFVRLLKASTQTPAVKRTVGRLEPLFDEALEDLDRHIDFTAFEVISCDTLAEVQLGSGLIALNSLLVGSR